MYVISVKHKSCFEEVFSWRYAALDRHCGSFSTGYPCWSSEKDAMTFTSVEEAEDWWNQNTKYLCNINSSIIKDTLGIRKKMFKTVKKMV